MSLSCAFGRRGAGPSLTRRGLFGSLAAGCMGFAWAPALTGSEARPGRGQLRRAQALQVRLESAQLQHQAPAFVHRTNGDAQRFGPSTASYTKGLPHGADGDVHSGVYDEFVAALSGGHHALEQVPMGCVGQSRYRRFVNPLSGMAFDLEGADPQHFTIPPAPALDGAEQAAELVELYWMALLRDVPFEQYATHPLARQAALALSRLSGFRGPRTAGAVTPDTLFRGFTSGDRGGFYVSQFLLKPIPFGAQAIDQRLRTAMPGVDHLTDAGEWLSVQNGCEPSQEAQFDAVRRWVRNGRDLSAWVRSDVLFQAYFNAMLILLAPPDASDLTTGGGLGAPLNPGNPYRDAQTQTGFGTFGEPAIATLVAEVATRALKAVWFQKWYVHRRLRPEELAGRLHSHASRGLSFPLHPDALGSSALQEIASRYGTLLLPQAYPEGAPLHPSYGAGHATVAGACVTVLKALFDERFEIANPVVPSADGLALLPYSGPPLTVGGELNKLAANVALARNFAGIHWRSDYSASLLLGEAVAVSLLRDHRMTFPEPFDGFTFTTFGGAPITV